MYNFSHLFLSTQTLDTQHSSDFGDGGGGGGNGCKGIEIEICDKVDLFSGVKILSYVSGGNVFGRQGFPYFVSVSCSKYSEPVW